MVASGVLKTEKMVASRDSAPEIEQADDPPTLKYRWTIENFSSLTPGKIYSYILHVEEDKWRVRIHKGNNVDHLCIYVHVDPATFPNVWSRYALLSIAVVDQIHGKHTIRKDTLHQFNAKVSYWGFTSFMSLSELYEPSRGYLVNDTCVIEAEVIDNLSYDAKKETGCVGLKNQDVIDRENMDVSQMTLANVVGVTTEGRLTDVGPSSASVIPPLRNLRPDEIANNHLFEENKPSVVSIINLVPPQGFGSGFIWDTEGHIVTNYHVIRGASDLSVTLADGTEYKGKVVGYNQDNDVAVLHIDAPKEKLRPIKVGISFNLLVGQKVYAIGHPFGLDHTFTTGVISRLIYRTDPAANGQRILYAIQTDASINPGNSGGPLLDSSGYLIGIVKSIYSQIGESCGIAFAVPVDTVKGIVGKYVKFGEGREAYIGGHGGSFARRSHRERIRGT